MKAKKYVVIYLSKRSKQWMGFLNVNATSPSKAIAAAKRKYITKGWPRNKKLGKQMASKLIFRAKPY